MHTPEERILWFLSDPSFTEQEFEKLAILLNEGKGQELVQEARAIRKAVRKRDWSEVRRKLHREPKANLYDDPLLDGASRLLLVEANMNVRSALKVLYEALGSDQPLPGNNSFQRGIKRLKERYQPSEILSAAQRIRNQMVHQSPDVPNVAWPLKGREK